VSGEPGSGIDPVAPDLSVVVANYNSGDELSRCMRSLYECAGDVRLDVVVVDNASADDSVERAVGDRPQVRVIRNPDNRGTSAAWNQGILSTRSEFVFVLNPDAEIAAGTMEAFLKVARDRPRAGVVGALVRDPDGSIYPSARKVPSLWEGLWHILLGPVWPENPWSRRYRMADWDRRSPRQVDWVSGSSMLLRRAALDQVGTFDEIFFIYAEDMDICTRMRMAGWEVWFSPEIEIVHVGGTATSGSRRMTLEHSRSIYRYFAKHHAASGWRRALRPPAWAALRLRAAFVSWRKGDR
jgi:N-acetylglucosaminyl-diphospho-decaprenol L-rhamnosyltransferase